MGFQQTKTRLNVSVIGDILDSMGRLHQFLPPAIRPILHEMTVVGRAMPVLINDVFGTPARPFGKLTDALDQLEPDEIYLARSGRIACAAWGELLTATALGRGASGAIIDGYHRDTRSVLAQDFPVFSRGSYGQDAGARSSVDDFRVPVEIGGVSIQPGDLLFGDLDGIVVIPQSIEAEVLERAAEKLSTESVVRDAIENGMSSTAAYERFQVL